MEPTASYAVVAAARSRQMTGRLAIGAFIGVSAFVLAPSIWPLLWFAAMAIVQSADGMLARSITASDADLPRRSKALYIGMVFLSSSTYAAISAYFWFACSEPGSWFGLLLAAGGMLHVSLRSYASRGVMIAGALPHALALFIPVAVSHFRHQFGLLQTTVVAIGAILYLAQLASGVRQSRQFVASLHDANTQANAAREQAERASAAKSEFLATVSHEIRTPMNAVLSAAHLLKRTALTPQQEEHVAMLTNGGEVLVGLLNDVLDISKIEAGKMVLEETNMDLDQALNALIRLYEPRAGAKGVGLVLEARDAPSAICTDPLRLRQILFNLLSNAVKFTDQGVVTLRAGRRLAGAAEWLWFEVQDSGIGIDEEAMGRLFGSFEQARAETARRHGGTGLGLAISRKLAEMMGGSLTCESAPGRGSTFRLELPLVHPIASEGGQDEEGVIDLADLRPLSILVAEDHEVNRKIVSLFLEPLGWRLTFARHGGEAVELAGLEAYHAILMDMQMPVMDGVEASLAIRGSAGPNARTPIIALTANALGHHREAWAPVGAAGFLTKPINPELLVATLVAATAAQGLELRAANAA